MKPNHKTIFGVMAFSLMAVMCQESPTPVQEVDKEKPCSVSFSPEIKSMGTRMMDDSFEEGDKISVYACYDESLSSDNYAQNIRYSYSNGLFEASSPISYPSKEAALTFYAVYPYGNYSTPDILFTVSSDQSSESDYAASDLMTASAVSKDKEIVSLKFTHRLAKVVLNLEEVSSKDCSVTFCRLYTSVDANITDNDYRESGSRYNVVACPDGRNSYKVILPPQKISAGNVVAEIIIDDKVYEWVAESDIYLSSGIEHIYTVTIKDNRFIISSDINDWDDESGAVDVNKD